LWGRFSWGEWPASAGALAYAAWRTWGLARTGKLSAAGTPYYFMVLLGGAGIFLFIGAVIGAALKG